MGPLPSFVILVYFLLFASLVAAELEIVFKFAGVTSAAESAFRRDVEQAQARVRGWWGRTFEGRIMIDVTPNQVYSMALIPAWRGERGRMIFGAKRVNAGEAATIHEMIHVYAPNANRMLAEGLAVYGHDKLDGNPAFPNFGQDIDRLISPLASKKLLLALEHVPTPAPLESVIREGEAMAGSFVRFLIDRFGMEKFRELYALTPLRERERDAGNSERWGIVYGQSLENLADLWLNALRAGPRP